MGTYLGIKNTGVSGYVKDAPVFFFLCNIHPNLELTLVTFQIDTFTTRISDDRPCFCDVLHRFHYRCVPHCVPRCYGCDH